MRSPLGLSSATNIVVVKSALNMSINPVTGDLRLPTTTVSGTISDPADYTVWVNGVKATVTGNNWEADNVPLPAGGGVTAIQVRAIPNADNGGNGTGVGGGGPVTFDNLGNPGQDDDMEPGALSRQTGVVVDSAVWGYNTVWYYPLTASYELTQEDGLYEPTQEEDHVSGSYSFAKGGKVTEDWKACFIDGTDDTKTVWVLAPGGAVTNCNGVTVTNGSLPAGVGYGLENGKLSGKYWPNPDCIITQDKNSTVKITFYAGGPGVLGQQVLVAVNPPSQAQQEVTQPGFASGGPVIPYEQTSIPGLGKNLGTDGWAYGEKDNGTLVDVTPTAGAPMYNFPWPNASAYVLSIQANYIDLTESAVLGLVPEFCVGQKVTFVTALFGIGDDHGTGALIMFARINSIPKFPGQAIATQLINGQGSIDGIPIPVPFATGSAIFLDNVEIYPESQASLTNNPANPSSNLLGTVSEIDQPGIPITLAMSASDNEHFNTYFRFKPDGDSDNIYVTLGRADWDWHGNLSYTGGSPFNPYTLSNWTISGAVADGPKFNLVNDFPVWIGVCLNLP
jgi:hypothetical protein